MEVRFRGTGLTRLQRLVLGEDGRVSGEIVSSPWLGLKLRPLELHGGSVRSMVVRSKRNLAAGFFFLLATLVWFGWGLMMFSGILTDIGGALFGVLLWLVLFLVAVELGAAALMTRLEIRTDRAWSEPFAVSVAPWSKRKVRSWVDRVAEELELPPTDDSRPTETSNDHT